MKTYYKNGIYEYTNSFLNYSDEFCIQEIENFSETKYMYTGDSLKYELDSELVGLYDKFRNLLFNNINKYYSELNEIPHFIYEAGYNSDCNLDSNTFCKLVDKYKSQFPSIYKHLYLIDVQFLIATIQNLLIGMDYSFINYFVQISTIEIKNYLTDMTSTMFTLNNQNSIYLSSLIETYFTKAYSILDILTKICYEFEHKHDTFENLQKLTSTNIIWGDRKKLSINNKENTVFARNNIIKLIETLRNEVVHNGSLEQYPRVFISVENNKIVERFMLLPDYVDGILSTVKSRNHFFSNCNKANELLPELHISYLKEILNTIKYINQKY